MKLTKILLCTALFLGAVGCVQVVEEPVKPGSQLAVSSVWDIPSRYPAGSTFALSPKYLKAVSLKEEVVREAYGIYSNAITTNLQRFGYRLAMPNDKVDFYVGFGAALAEDLSDKTISEKFGITPGLQEAPDLEKGSFLIYVEDGAMQQRVWRGAVQGFVQEGLEGNERIARAEHVVNIVLAQFYKQ